MPITFSSGMWSRLMRFSNWSKKGWFSGGCGTSFAVFGLSHPWWDSSGESLAAYFHLSGNTSGWKSEQTVRDLQVSGSDSLVFWFQVRKLEPSGYLHASQGMKNILMCVLVTPDTRDQSETLSLSCSNCFL